MTVTPATEITSVTYSVENSTLSSEVSVDAVDYTVDGTETGVNVTFKPHILRHEQASTGAADIVITITDKYGRSVNVTDHITIMEITNTVFLGDRLSCTNHNIASTVDDFNTSDYYLAIVNSLTPKGIVNGNTVNILDSFRGIDVDANYKLIRTEFINNGEFVVTTSQPTQTVPTMTNGTLFVKASNAYSSATVPIALLDDFLPSTWDDASIFDNLLAPDVFKYKPNNSYLKLYTYNDGWDDRDYIIFNTVDPTRAREIVPQYDIYISDTNTVTTNTTGLIAEIVPSDVSSGSAYRIYNDGLVYPRFVTDTVKWMQRPSGQLTILNESDYGITYSSSNSSSSDKALTSHIYMYATDVSSLLTGTNELRKTRTRTIVLNNAYQNNRPATDPHIGILIKDDTIISLQ